MPCPDCTKAIIRKLSLLILAVVLVASLFLWLSRGRVYEKKDLVYGLTFSKQQAIDLGLDWRLVYAEIFNDLKAKHLRLSAYWNEIEATKGVYRWDDTDWQIQVASSRDADIILAVGGRLPRWPECHFPAWLGTENEQAKEDALLTYIKNTVLRYRGNNHIVAWQVENEPFLPQFGECPPLKVELLDKEIALVRSLDSRPIVVTDSGELSIWARAAARADIFGTSIYRTTYSKRFQRYIHYPITPEFFKIKKNLVSIFAHPAKWIVIELQAEPWGKTAFQYLPKEERDLTMDEQKFQETLEFARQTGFREFYLWGVEWWYWEKTKQDNPALWSRAKTLFSQDLAAKK